MSYFSELELPRQESHLKEPKASATKVSQLFNIQVPGLETHYPHAIKGHFVMEILDHVIPPQVSLWVGEIREGSGPWPNLEDKNQSYASKSVNLLHRLR